MSVSDTQRQNTLVPQAYLADLAELAVKFADSESVLYEACRVIAGAVDADLSELLEVQPDRLAGVVRAGFGWLPGIVGDVAQPMPEDTLAEHVLQTGQPATSWAIPGHSQFAAPAFALPHYLGIHEVQASAAVLLPSGLAGAPHAVLQVHRRIAGAWTEQELATLEACGRIIETVLHRMRTDSMAQEEIRRLRLALEASEAESSQRDHELAAANARLHTETQQRREAEEILRQSHKMEAMGKLTGGIAHDFNNLLQGICGSLELMQVRVSQGRTAEINNYIETALASANRAALLAGRLLTFSQRRPSEPRPSRISNLVAGMEEIFRRTVGPMIRIETRHANEVWPSLCDPNQIEGALLDLVINARDAMQDGGTILIETANVFLSKPAVALGDVPPGEYAVLSVADTGTGMTPSIRAQAFDPFFTTKPAGQGAGLGLAMVQSLVQEAGGHVRLRSEVGEGTMVNLYLPRYLGLVDEAELASGPGKKVTRTSVLVVDDEPAARMFLTDVLSDAGYTVVEAHDSRSGLHALESEIRIDLMVTDVGLPGGMNGRQLADVARQRRPGLKVLFVTGYEEEAATRSNLLDEGVLVMTKPFGMEALKATVQGIIGR